MTVIPRHAPVPPLEIGSATACAHLLPRGAVFDCQLDVDPDRRSQALPLLDALFRSYGLPTNRLVRRPGLYLFSSADGLRRWLVVDYLVPGTRNEADTGWLVDLNHAAGRCGADAPGHRAPALDRYIVEVAAIPEWLRHTELVP